MMNTLRVSEGRLLVVAFAASMLGAEVARAEVGVSGVQQVPAPAVQVYQFGVINDNPDPFGLWVPYSGSGGGRVVLNPNGAANGDGPPSVVSNGALGLHAVAWSKNSPNGYDIVISRFDGSAWTSPQVIVGTPGVNELDPELILGSDGSAHLFYWVDAPTPRVFYTSAPTGLATWSTPIPVSPPGQVTCRPAGAFFGGVLRVVYEVHEFGYGNSPRQVVIARFEAGSFVTEVVAMTNHLGEVRPQVHAHGGRLWVDWIDTETSGHDGELAWTRLDSQGAWEPIGYQPFAGLEQREYLVRGAARMLAIQP